MGGFRASWGRLRAVHLPDTAPFESVRVDEYNMNNIIATYDYTDQAGRLLYQVCRLEPKDFRQRRADGNAHNWRKDKTLDRDKNTVNPGSVPE